MFDFFNNRLFDLNRDGKVDIFEKAFVYHTLFEDDDKAVSRNVRNDDYDDCDDDECDCASDFRGLKISYMTFSKRQKQNLHYSL